MNIPLVKTVAGVASFAALIPTPVGVAVGVAGMATFAAAKLGHFRPSTYIRLAEDGVLSATRKATTKAKQLPKQVRTEYAARKIEAAQRALEVTFEQLEGMTPEERREYDAAQLMILQRVAELRAARRAKRVVQPRAKRRAKSEVHA